MILIADSGSTKIDWAFLIEGKSNVEWFETKGFNPVYHRAKTLHDLVLSNKELLRKARWVREIHYYGAGCSNEERNKTVIKGLQQIFTDAHITVEHDLVGGVRAVAENQPCIVGIMGTGSNCCYFNGKEIEQKTPSLGFILGDEGSGGSLGKQLIQKYLYGELPDEMADEFISRKITKDVVLEKVYNNPRASEFMASFAPILFKYRELEIAKKIIQNSFHEFFENHIIKYSEAREVPVHLVGSIAFHFKGFIIEKAQQLEVKTGKILKQPMDGLVAYHRQQLTEKTDLW